MTTALDGIYTALKNMSITYTPGTITTWNYTDLDATKVPKCPQRYLACSGNTEGGMAFVAIGRLTSVDWTIIDTVLLKPALEGESLKENSANIVKYIDGYLGAIRTLRAPTAQSHVTDAKFEPGVYYWPEDAAGIPYIGVKVTLTIQEVIST